MKYTLINPIVDSLVVIAVTAFFFPANQLRGQPLDSNDQKQLTVIYTTNNNGYLSDCGCGEDPLGGLAKRKTLFELLRKRHGTVLFFDAGDLFGAFGYLPAQDTMVAYIYEQLGYDAINVGDQELINGIDFFFRHLVNRNLPLIATNLKLKNGLERSIKKSAITSVNGISVGVLGFLSQEAFKYYPESTPVVAEAGFTHQALQQAVDSLRSRVEILILLSHLGYDDDVKVAKNVTGIDLIVGGHSQAELNDAELVNQTLIVQSGGDGQYVGELLLTLDAGQKIVYHKNLLIPLNSEVAKDPDILKLVNPFDNQ